ncbi:MAG: protein kinase [Polyangiaceae bacterium]|nr:protein kinase [Polyangiaceae bacterium]
MIGATIGGRYEIVRLLGQGGMGSVYEALHTGTGRRVAVKVILMDPDDPADQLARLEIEARTAAALGSRHVAAVLDAGRDEASGAAYLAMEYLDGEDLQALLKRLGRLPPDLALRIAAQACRGLARAHEAGVVHRDVKPANLFLARGEGDGERVVKILDFGIAKLRPESAILGAAGSRLTRTGSMLGSPLYMSPEQARGQRTLDHRTDLWSLSVVLYEALAGRTPHPADGPVGELIVSICVSVAPRIRIFAPDVPAEIERLLERALAIEPAERYQRAAELLADLAALLPGGSTITEDMLAPAGPAAEGLEARIEAVQTLAAESGEAASLDLPDTRRPDSMLDSTSDSMQETRIATGRAPPARRLDCLPAPLTSFIGREREVSDLRRLLTGGARLVTLLGPGGTGKTRLALRVATDLRAAYEAGAVFADLSSIADPEAVPQAIAAAIGAREEPGEPLLSTVARQLRARELLLVLDNCEHLVAASAAAAERLLASCPRLRVLATTREVLAVDGETVFGVAPLPVPPAAGVRGDAGGATAEAAGGSAAVRLFVERARAADPAFEFTDRNAPAVVHVCQRLDGIPLAIELAAARVRAMPIEQIAARLRDRFALLTGGRRATARRQQTLRDLIDWSHDLLAPPERALFRRLAIFHGGFSLAAVEAVCAAPGDPEGVDPAAALELLIHLVNKSLVVRDPEAGADRYRLLETIRHYAWEKLQASGEELAARERHTHHFIRVAEEAEPALRTGAQAEWLERLGADHDNLRIALDFCSSSGRVIEGLRLAGALGRFFWLRGHHVEGSAWLGRFLARCGAAAPGPAGAQTAAPAPLRAKAAAQLAMLLQHGPERARPWWAEALAAYRAAGDGWGIALSLRGEAELALQAGHHAAAASLLGEGLALARATGDPWIAAVLLNQIGRCHRDRLELAEAAARLEEAVAHARASGDRSLTGLVLRSLGLTRSFQGQHAAARSLLEEGVALERELGSRICVAETLCSLGGVLQCLGEHGRAAACYEEALGLAWSLGIEELVGRAYVHLAGNALAHGALGEARRCLRETFLRARECAHKDQLAWALLVLGALARREGQPVLAVRFFGAERALEESFGVGLHPPTRAPFESMLDEVRAELGPAAEAAWTAGRAMSLDDVLAVAAAYLSR